MSREIIGNDRFLKVYLMSTPLAVCEARDTKGLYRRARQGSVLEFTGINVLYEVSRVTSSQLTERSKLEISDFKVSEPELARGQVTQ